MIIVGSSLQPVLDKQIDFECVVYDNAFEVHLHRDLASNLVSRLPQRGRQKAFIRMLKQARTQSLMNLKTEINNVACDHL